MNPGKSAAKIWGTVVFIGPFLLYLAGYAQYLWTAKLPGPNPYSRLDFGDFYFNLVGVGAVLSILPLLITWGLLSAWHKKKLPPALMSERMLLLAMLFTAGLTVVLMGRVDSFHPLTNTLLLFLPYFFASLAGIVWALGWPFRAKQP